MDKWSKKRVKLKNQIDCICNNEERWWIICSIMKEF